MSNYFKFAYLKTASLRKEKALLLNKYIQKNSKNTEQPVFGYCAMFVGTIIFNAYAFTRPKSELGKGVEY